MKDANDANDSDNEEFYGANGNDSNVESNDENDTTQNVPKRKKRRTIYDMIDLDYQKLFDENKHLLDMSCDRCTNVFESLEAARDHYFTEHNVNRGYIKALTGTKFFNRSKIMQYLARQSNPEMFKYTHIISHL